MGPPSRTLFSHTLDAVVIFMSASCCEAGYPLPTLTGLAVAHKRNVRGELQKCTCSQWCAAGLRAPNTNKTALPKRASRGRREARHLVSWFSRIQVARQKRQGQGRRTHSSCPGSGCRFAEGNILCTAGKRAQRKVNNTSEQMSTIKGAMGACQGGLSGHWAALNGRRGRISAA